MSHSASISLRRLLVVALLPLLTTGCAVGHYYGSISGRVVDKDTGQPIEGAAVVAVYNVVMDTVGGLAEDFADAQETQSDAQGDFLLPGKFIFQPRLGMGHFAGDPDVYVAKPGYGEYGYHPKATMREVSGFGLYELPKLSDIAERRKWSHWERISTKGLEKLPYFRKVYNNEREAIGYPRLIE